MKALQHWLYFSGSEDWHFLFFFKSMTNTTYFHRHVWSCLSFSSRRNLPYCLHSDFKNPEKNIPNFFSSNSVDDGVGRRREQNVNESHEGVGVRRYGDVEVVREERDATHEVETHHGHKVSAARVERLPAFLAVRCRSQNRAQNLHVGEEDERYVHAHEEDDHSESRRSVFLRAAACQAHQRHVVTVAVLDDVGAAEALRTGQSDQRRHDGAAAHQSKGQQLRQRGGVDDFGVAQRLADSHVSVERHRQQQRGLQRGEEVREEHLSQAAGQRDLVPVEEEAEEYFGDDGGRYEHVDDAQCADEEVHGAVQALHAADHVHQQTVSQQHRQVGGGERQRQQTAVFLQLRKTSEHERDVGEVSTQ